jgi:hypothetical protein
MKREVITTELGEELRCFKCRSFWPVDPEFFYFHNGRPHSYCKACYVAERKASGTYTHRHAEAA